MLWWLPEVSTDHNPDVIFTDIDYLTRFFATYAIVHKAYASSPIKTGEGQAKDTILDGILPANLLEFI